MFKKPIIGIGLDWQPNGSFSSRSYYALRRGYARAIERAGGTPILLPHNLAGIAEYGALLDGVLIPGGETQCPPEWYVDGVPSYFQPNMERLDFDVAMIQMALEFSLPLLGICHGMQCLAYCLGGKLHSDWRRLYPDSRIRHRFDQSLPGNESGSELLSEAGAGHKAAPPLHAVQIQQPELVAVFGSADFAVVSGHQECVAQLSAHYIAGYAPDGMIEAVRVPEHPFAVGVQWHPELGMTVPDQNLFAAFVRAARQHHLGK